MPPLTQEARAELVASALKAAPSDAERRPLPWRGSELHAPVVRLRAQDVLLNPFSHRIQAQLLSLPDAERALINTDPFSQQAQDSIADIIRATKGYSVVKANIARDRQQEPGLITHLGVLVNANTRTVALRELFSELDAGERQAFEYVKVQVLPSDAQQAEIATLELNFQMRVNTQQDYTFTNQLLFIRDLLDSGLPPEVIGLEMDRSLDTGKPKDRERAAKGIELEDRMRQTIHELIEASGGALRWESFDNERQNILEIVQATERIEQRRGADVAIRVRQAKLAGVLAGLDYRKVRNITENYLDNYIVPALEDEDILRKSAQALAHGSTVPTSDLDGLDALMGLDALDGLDSDPNAESTSTGADIVTLGPLFDLLVKAGKGDDDFEPAGSVKVPTEDGDVEMTFTAFRTSVYNAMSTAATQVDLDSQGQDALDLPRKQLAAAGAACDKARRALVDLTDAKESVDLGKLRDAYYSYMRSHDDLVGHLESQFGLTSAQIDTP